MYTPFSGLTPINRKKRRHRNLAVIPHLVLKLKLSQVAVARRYHLTRQRVSQIVKKARAASLGVKSRKQDVASHSRTKHAQRRGHPGVKCPGQGA